MIGWNRAITMLCATLVAAPLAAQESPPSNAPGWSGTLLNAPLWSSPPWRASTDRADLTPPTDPPAVPQPASLDAAELNRSEAFGPEADSAAAELLPLPHPDGRMPPPAGPLTLDEVLNSVEQSYPLLVAAAQERAVAAGEQLSARGAYDHVLTAENFTGAPGYYQTNRAGMKLERYTLPGGKVMGGYRIGRGSFEPWYQERQTNDGGEFKVGFEQSLLQGRDIDKRRTALQKTDLARAAAEPSIDKQRIYFIEYAAVSYWKWVATGQAYLVARDLLELAERRVDGINIRIESGILKEIERVDNRRLIVSRQAKVFEADRKFQQAAVELSLYLRDEAGRPVLPEARRLPWFTEPARPDERRFIDDETAALAMRPEPRYLRLDRDKYLVELRFAENLMLPQLNALATAGQDVGQPTSPKRDKSRFELETGLMFEVPLQRRYAVGQRRVFEAELARVRAELQYAEDRVVADVRYAAAGLRTAYEEYLRAKEGVSLAEEMQRAEFTNFELGNSNILVLNLREQATADARLLVVDALAQYYFAAAEYRAALGIDAGNVGGR